MTWKPIWEPAVRVFAALAALIIVAVNSPAQQAKQVSSWCDTINGLTNVTDPKTGAKFQVFTGPKPNYYQNGLGVKVNSVISPGPDFYPLQVDNE